MIATRKDGHGDWNLLLFLYIYFLADFIFATKNPHSIETI